MTPDQVTWLYWKIYPGSGTQLDAAIRTVVSQLVHDFSVEIRSWFFIRFVDAHGPHVRFRCLSILDVVDEISERDKAISSTLPRLPRETRQSVFGADVFDVWPRHMAQGRPRITTHLYEAEKRKWGTGDALFAAENIFQISSEEAVAFLTRSDFNEAPRLRIAYGSLVFQELRQALLMSDETAKHFFLTHAEWWAGETQSSDRSRSIRDAAEQLRDDVWQYALELSSDEATLIGIRRFAEAVARSVSAQTDLHKNPLYFVHHHLHLMLNRLGVSPPEEAALAMLEGLGRPPT